MTNEQLAVFIQQGDNNELIPLLWDKVKKVFYIHADRFYNAYRDVMIKRGITPHDLKQYSYEAFLCAITSYKQDNGFKFTSYIRYSFKHTMRPYLYSNDLLNECSSYNIPISDNKDIDDELLDLIPDDTAHTKYECVEHADIYRVLHEVVDLLPSEQQLVIKAYFFDNMTLKDISIMNGCSIEWVRQLKRKALNNLRNSKVLRMLFLQ